MSPFLKQERQPPWLAQFSLHKAQLVSKIQYIVLFT